MTDVMIEARGLTKRYDDQVALKNASFQLHRGEILGFLGPNGAGKSTTMKILTCFIAPTEGTATVNGCDIWDDPIGVRTAIGYLPESTPLYSEMLVYEYLQWVAQMRGLTGETAQRRILKVIEDVALEDVVAKSIRELSKGYRQRVGLAQALVHEPPILILDEPMSGLDPNQAVEIRALIREIGKDRTVILSTHNLAEVQVTCQRVLIIDKGRIVADDTPEALARGKGGPRYRVSVLEGQRLEGGKVTKANGGAAKARDVFRSIKGVDAVRELSGKRDELRLEITASTEDDLRAELFRAAVESGLILVGIEAQKENLEEVFQDLTRGAASAPYDDDEDLDDDEDEDDEEDGEDGDESDESDDDRADEESDDDEEEDDEDDEEEEDDEDEEKSS